MERIILSSLEQMVIRIASQKDLRNLEWGGELIHFRRIFSDAFQNSLHGAAIIWIAEFNPFGLLGQLIVSLRSTRPELSDGRKRAYIYGFRVKPEFRSQGVGRSMLLHAEKDLIRRGYNLITLNVAQDNLGAWKLYESLGYLVVGDDDGEWSYVDHKGRRIDVHEPAWRMEKILR